MISVLYGILLVISCLLLLYMVQKNYVNINIHYCAIVLLTPVILLGYWLKSRVSTPEGAAVSFCLIYIDSTVLLTLCLFMILHFLRIQVKAWIKVLVYGAAFAHLLMVWLCMKNSLYYKTITVYHTAAGSVTKMTSGPLKVVHWIYLTAILAAIAYCLVLAFTRKGTYSRRSLWLYTFIVSAGLVIYLVEILIDVDFSSLPFLYVIASLMIVKNYDFSYMHDISLLISKQQAHDLQKGYVAFDLEKRYLNSNETAFRFIPELAHQIIDSELPPDGFAASIFYSLISEYETNPKAFKQFQAGEVICKCEMTGFSMKKNGKTQGYLFSIRDVTEEEKIVQLMNQYNSTLEKDVTKKTENIRNIQKQVVLGLANMVENRDSNTGGHVKRTSDVIGYVVNAVKEQGLYEIDDEYASDIVRAAPMHDLGKITVENSILLKPGKLTDEEYAIMKTHAVKSGEFVNIILNDVEEEHFVKVAYNVARHHHERWDGRGYPDGLVGEMIPLEARIMAIADVYDALVSKRCYKQPMSFDKAASIMLEGMGTQFDPNMYTAFLACREQLEDYYRSYQG